MWKAAFRKFGRPYHFKFFKGCLPQILLGPFLNTLAHLLFVVNNGNSRVMTLFWYLYCWLWTNFTQVSTYSKTFMLLKYIFELQLMSYINRMAFSEELLLATIVTTKLFTAVLFYHLRCICFFLDKISDSL